MRRNICLLILALVLVFSLNAFAQEKFDLVREDMADGLTGVKEAAKDGRWKDALDGFGKARAIWNKEVKVLILGEYKKDERFRETYPGEDGLLTNVKSCFAEKLSGALGHGAALTFPDRPYLKWSFRYEDPQRESGLRNNPATFLDGCRALHKLFRSFAKLRPDLAEDRFSSFKDIRGEVQDILGLQAPKRGRIQAWQKAARNGNLFATGPETIPRYNEDVWHNERENLVRKKESSAALDLSIYRFYQAAAVYRIYILRMLLPKHGLLVT